MVVYMFSSASSAIPETAKPRIAGCITDRYCHATGAHRASVHVFFMPEATVESPGANSNMLQCRIWAACQDLNAEDLKLGVKQALEAHSLPHCEQLQIDVSFAAAD